MIVVVPDDTPLTVQFAEPDAGVEDTLAIEEFDDEKLMFALELEVAEMVFVDTAFKVVEPVDIVSVGAVFSPPENVRLMDDTTGVFKAAITVTVQLALAEVYFPLTAGTVYVMVAVPVPMAVTVPLAVTVATDVDDELHVGLAEEFVVPVSSRMSPTLNVLCEGLTDAVAVTGLTLTLHVVLALS